MIEPTMIELTGITFRNHLGALDLATPKYPSLIDYTLLSEKIRSRLQLEPAFQLINLPAEQQYCIFKFVIAEPEVFFTTINQKPVLRALLNEPEPETWLDVIEFGEQVCSLRFQANGWQDRIRTVRIHCSHKNEPGVSQSNHGLTLVVLKPGADPAYDGKRSAPLTPSDFKMKVTGFSQQEKPFPIYEIFDYSGIPAGISVEPVFRTGCQRPLANVEIEMAAEGKAFKEDTSTNDDVPVWKRNSPRPEELSKVVKDSNSSSIHFSYDTTGLVSKIGDPVRIFSFMVDVGDLLPGLVSATSLASLQATSSSGAENHCFDPNLPLDGPRRRRRPRPRLGKFHVDPIMVHERPPAGVP